MKSVNRGDNVLFVLNLLRKQVLKIEEGLRSKHTVDIILVDTNMINFQKDCPAIVLNSNVSSLLCGHLQLKNLSARSKEVSGILKQVESYNIATKQRFQNFNSVLESLVNIRTWEW
jgi:hypothetical protein